MLACELEHWFGYLLGVSLLRLMTRIISEDAAFKADRFVVETRNSISLVET